MDHRQRSGLRAAIDNVLSARNEAADIRARRVGSEYGFAKHAAGGGTAGDVARRSKCRWGLVTLPVAPESAMRSPFSTVAPDDTSRRGRCAYCVYSLSSCLMTGS